MGGFDVPSDCTVVFYSSTVGFVSATADLSATLT